MAHTHFIDILNDSISGNNHNPNNPIIMFVLFAFFSINLTISLSAATEIIRLLAAIAAFIPALGATIIWVKNNMHHFKKKKSE